MSSSLANHIDKFTIHYYRDGGSLSIRYNILDGTRYELVVSFKKSTLPKLYLDFWSTHNFLCDIPWDSAIGIAMQCLEKRNLSDKLSVFYLGRIVERCDTGKKDEIVKE